MDASQYIYPALGGALIGLGASALMLFSGRVAGVSGIVSGLLKIKPGDLAWRLAFVLGMVVGGAAIHAARPDLFGTDIDRSVGAVVLGGLLVGFGTRLGSGCTSGHGVCGVARLGPRSIIATLTFIASGAVVVYLVNHVAGGAV